MTHRHQFKKWPLPDSSCCWCWTTSMHRWLILEARFRSHWHMCEAVHFEVLQQFYLSIWRSPPSILGLDCYTIISLPYPPIPSVLSCPYATWWLPLWFSRLQGALVEAAQVAFVKGFRQLFHARPFHQLCSTLPILVIPIWNDLLTWSS